VGVVASHDIHFPGRGGVVQRNLWWN